MSFGALVALMVLAESLVLFVAVRWLVNGVRSAECIDWPPVMPLAPAGAVPGPRDSSARGEDVAAAAS
jgi:hypothetical protein